MSRRSAIQDKYAQQQAHQSSRRRVVMFRFSIYVVCIEPPAAHPDWQGKEWLRERNSVNLISHNQSCWPGKEHLLQTWLNNRAQEIAKAVQAQEGGVWTGHVRDATNDPVPERAISRAEIDGVQQHILNGPDGDAWQYIAQLKEKQAAEKEAKTSTSTIAAHLRGVQDALQHEGVGLQSRPGPVMADFENDPALQADPEAERWENG